MTFNRISTLAERFHKRTVRPPGSTLFGPNPFPRSRYQNAACAFLAGQRPIPDMDLCTYCGEPASHRDHVVPVSFTHPVNLRTYHRGDWVWACADCNLRLGSRMLTTVLARVTFLSTYLPQVLRKDLDVREWDEVEIKALGPRLRRTVRHGLRARERALRRLDHTSKVANGVEA